MTGSSSCGGSRGSLRVLCRGVSLLNAGERLSMVGLFIAMVGTGAVDATIVALVMPLVQSIIQPELLTQIKPFAKLAEWFGFTWGPKVFPWVAGALAILIALSTASNLLIGWTMDKQAARCRNRLGHDLVRDLINAPFLWFLSKNSAVLARQVFADIRVWRNDFLQSLMQIGQSLILILLPSVAVVLLAPSYGLLAIVVMGIIGLLVVLAIRPRIHLLVRRQKLNQDATMRTLLQLLTGIREVKTTNRAPFFLKQFDVRHRKGNHYLTSQRLLSQLSPSLILALGQISFIVAAVLLWASGLSGAEITAQLAMLAVVVSRVLPAINKGASSYNQVIGSLPYVEALVDSFDEVQAARQTLGRPSGEHELPRAWRAIEFRGVAFRYPGAEESSIQGLDLRLERGKHYGVVGRSGAGKSTFINLLLGLLQPTGGQILVDEVPVDAIKSEQWSEQIGYVPQDVFLIDETLRANIAFGEELVEMDESRLMHAVSQARLTTVVEGLPDGLDTQMGERGSRLSGGQAQRVAIARALYRNPSLVILDEATSALDSVTEADIQASFDALGPDILAIAIAHRISSLRHCDEIIVLEDGRVHAIGSYEDLIASDSLFRQLAAQAQREDEA